MITGVLVCVGAALGAPLRHLTDAVARAAWGDRFPWGTMIVNVVGSWLLGLVAALLAAGAIPAPVAAGVGAGFCGALTTFSTFGVETWYLARRGDAHLALANVVGAVVAGIVAAVLGWGLGYAAAGHSVG